ncbi:hypothetical protein AA313_de0204927 [Arthrobotrys entomopaga]|nr:hypothetical protein AA313_de0204927 [Arthrobotrys entomopaga]
MVASFNYHPRSFVASEFSNLYCNFPSYQTDQTIQYKMKTFLYLLFFALPIAAYVPHRLEPRACAANNLYRTLERLQRESSFCDVLLSPNPTVSIPSSISATPIASFSSACTCIVGALTTSATTTTPTTTTPSCTNTVTLIPDPITVTSTVTYTPTSTSSTSVPTSYLFDWETASRLWGCGIKITNTPSFDYFAACGEHQNTGEAHSGDWYFRVVFPMDHTGTFISRWGNKTPIPVLANTKYQLSIWYRQLTYNEIICTPHVTIGDQGLPTIDGPDTVVNGLALLDINLNTGLQWTQTLTSFTTGSGNGIGLFITVQCSCPSGNCGDVYTGFDDISILQTA